jgi:hypothetical protein
VADLKRSAMKTAQILALALMLAGCSSTKLETPVELKPFVLYPEASVYRLLSAPEKLDGVRIRTYGVIKFYFDGSAGFLYPSRVDVDSPINLVELHFSKDLASKEWFRSFSKQKIYFEGWVVGVVKIASSDSQNKRLVLDDVSEFDVKAAK